MGNTSVFVQQYVSEVLRSATPVETGDGVLSDRKHTRDTDDPGIMILPGNDEVGIRSPPSPQKNQVAGSVAQLKCICTNACNKQEELEAIAQQVKL